jgi:hypothetical protein
MAGKEHHRAHGKNPIGCNDYSNNRRRLASALSAGAIRRMRGADAAMWL